MKFLKFNIRKHIIIKDEEARRLTALFLDGDTSPEDEKKLYDYYASKRIADDLLQYKEMFAWYASMHDGGKQKSARPKHKVLVAASVTVAVLATVGLVTFKSFDAEACSIYAGSYIIRDGKKITDVSKIISELRQADRLVDSTMYAVSTGKTEEIEHEAISSALASIQDPQLREMLLADLSF